MASSVVKVLQEADLEALSERSAKLVDLVLVAAKAVQNQDLCPVLQIREVYRTSRPSRAEIHS